MTWTIIAFCQSLCFWSYQSVLTPCWSDLPCIHSSGVWNLVYFPCLALPLPNLAWSEAPHPTAPAKQVQCMPMFSYSIMVKMASQSKHLHTQPSISVMFLNKGKILSLSYRVGMFSWVVHLGCATFMGTECFTEHQGPNRRFFTMRPNTKQFHLHLIPICYKPASAVPHLLPQLHSPSEPKSHMPQMRAGQRDTLPC